MDFKELSQQIDLKTGGLNVANHITEHPSDKGSFEEVEICLNFPVEFFEITSHFHSFAEFHLRFHVSGQEYRCYV